MALAAPFPGAGAVGLHQAPSEGRTGVPLASALAQSLIRIGLSSALLARPRVTPSVTLMLQQKQVLQDSFLKSLRIINF